MAVLNSKSVAKLSTLSTEVDAALSFYRGRPRRARLLLGAAALSSRVTGLGTAVSLLSRLVDRLK